MRAAFAIPAFRKLFVALAATMVADSVLLLTFGISVKELTGSSGAAGLALFWVVAPSIFAPLLGWVVDQLPRRSFLLIGYPLAAASLVPLAFVHDRGHVWVVYLVAFCYGIRAGDAPRRRLRPAKADRARGRPRPRPRQRVHQHVQTGTAALRPPRRRLDVRRVRRTLHSTHSTETASGKSWHAAAKRARYDAGGSVEGLAAAAACHLGHDGATADDAPPKRPQASDRGSQAPRMSS